MVATSLKPIETEYKGYHFRSRTEARWAVFFDALSIRYRYEHEGYILADTWYLPDFDLGRYFVEVKGKAPSDEELEKALLLCRDSRRNVFVLSGSPWPGEYQAVEICYDRGDCYLFEECYFVECGKCQAVYLESEDQWGCPCCDCERRGLVSQRLLDAYSAARGARFE